MTKQGVGTNRYSYCFNDPINCHDPNGNFGLFGAFVGGVVGGLAQLGADLFSGNGFSSGATYAGSIAGGALIGATGGLATPMMIGGSVAGSVIMGNAGYTYDTGTISPSRVAVSAAFGVVGGGASMMIGRQASSSFGAHISGMTSKQKGNFGEYLTDLAIRRPAQALGFSVATQQRVYLEGVRSAGGARGYMVADYQLRWTAWGAVPGGLGNAINIETKVMSGQLTIRQDQAIVQGLLHSAVKYDLGTVASYGQQLGAIGFSLGVPVTTTSLAYSGSSGAFHNHPQ